QPSTHTYRLSKFLKSAAIAAAKKRDYDQLESACQASGENFLFHTEPGKPEQHLRSCFLPLPTPSRKGRCSKEDAHYRHRKNKSKSRTPERFDPTIRFGDDIE
ncbi:MAG: hypothetical protein RBR77_13490, partial [Thauera sp.]|nr:hypothetical protein [Thauera sp.]